MKKLPKHKGIYGYTYPQIKSICKSLRIDENLFWEAFGINTCCCGEDGLTNYYVCDVENALYRIGHKLGKKYLWD